MTRVLIGIPTLNGPDRLKRCLDSIAACTRFDAFGGVTTLVCDDGSTEEFLRQNKEVIHESEQKIPGLEMLMNGKREGISTSWNKLVRHQQADVIVLVNDDIEVVDHWLDVLVHSLVKNRIAGMVGLNSYVGVTKGQVLSVGRPLRADYCEAPLLSGNGGLLASTGSIFAFRRQAYDEVGGFDERYFVFYEEVDFGVALLKKGYINFIADYPRVYHMGGATNSNAMNLIASEHMALSREKFREKWNASPDEMRERLPHRIHLELNEWNTQLLFLNG